MIPTVIVALLFAQPAQPAPGGAESVAEATDTQERPAVPLTRSERLERALREDGETASRLIPAIIRWGGHLSDGQAYDIALAIARNARQRELRPEVVVALIRVESGYNTIAVSPTSDYGLMQLHRQEVYRVDHNIAMGCEELATWRDTYDCGEREMLAHYNGGCNPPRVSWGYADRVLALAAEVH